MAVNPIVRYMLLCADWRLNGPNSRRVTIVGLISNIHSVEDRPYPLFYREFCVFLALTEGRERGKGTSCAFSRKLSKRSSRRPSGRSHSPQIHWRWLECLSEFGTAPFPVRACTLFSSGMMGLWSRNGR